MIILASCLCIILTGCTSTYDVKIAKSFEYDKSEIDVCQYIEKIDDTKIRNFNRSANKIDEGKYHVACPVSKINKLGKQEVTISINNVDVVLNFQVVDTTPPEIQIEKENLTVEENNEFFDLKKLITIKDSYDSKPVIGFTGEYDLSTPGKYNVGISAKDSNDNKSKKEVSIVVAEKEVKVIEKEVIVNGSSNASSNNSNGSNIQNNPSVPQSPPLLSSSPSKSFLFSEGFDMVTGFDACKVYRGASSGSCSPLMDSSNITYGYIYNP